MRRAAFVFAIFVACGGGQQKPTDNVRVDLSDAAIAPVPPKVVERLGIPHDAPCVATFDAAALARIEPLAQELEKILDLSRGTLLGSAAGLGLDLKRPVTIALAPLDATQKKMVADLRAAMQSPNPPAADELAKRMSSTETPIIIRVLVPTTNPAKLEDSLGKLLKSDGWKHTASGWEHRSMHVELDDDGDYVAVDVFATHQRNPKAYAEMKANAHDAVPALDKTLRMSWSPRALADVGFITGMTEVLGAVSGASIDPSQRQSILKEGFKEAMEGFAVATFERVEIEANLDPFEFTGRARPSGWTLPPDALAPSTGVVMPSATVLAQASSAFMKVWQFPGGSVSSALDMMREAGFAGMAAGIPHVLAASPAIDSRHDTVTAPFDLKRFDRVATAYGSSSHEIFVSVLPAGTKRAAAECAFAKGPCNAKNRLKLNAVAQVDSLFAKLYEIDKRFVIVSAESQSASLDAPTLATVSGMHIDIDTSMVTSLLAPGTLPRKLGGDLAFDGGALIFEVTPR